MKFVALLSGGKDSCFSAMQAIKYGHELVCLANLYPSPGHDGDELNSFMYQSAAHTAIPYLAQCFEKPLLRRQIRGKSLDQSLSYSVQTDASSAEYDEVEDLFLLLVDVKMRFPEIEGVCCGAIVSNYQRNRVENVCRRLNMTSLSYMWNRDRTQLIDDMIQTHQVTAILVKVSGVGLIPHKHLNKTLNEVRHVLQVNHNKYGLDLCGEGGEYETLVLDCPLFPRNRLVIDETSVFLDAEDDSIGNLQILRCHIEPKSKESNQEASCAPCFDSVESASFIMESSLTVQEGCEFMESSMGKNRQSQPPTASTMDLPVTISPIAPADLPSFSLGTDGFGHTAIIYPSKVAVRATEAQSRRDSVKLQVHSVLGQLKAVFAHIRTTYQKSSTADASSSSSSSSSRSTSGADSLSDVCYVHLYLSDMGDFEVVNEVYCQHFAMGGATASMARSPSRCCVAVPLPSGYYVAVEAMFFLNSDCSTIADSIGEDTKSAISKTQLSDLQRIRLRKRREILQIGSVSEWAPVCIGPYSQCNVLAEMVVLIAGQIALDPGAMSLRSADATNDTKSSCMNLKQTWAAVFSSQLRTCMQNYNRILHSAMQPSSTVVSASVCTAASGGYSHAYTMLTVYISKAATMALAAQGSDGSVAGVGDVIDAASVLEVVQEVTGVAVVNGSAIRKNHHGFGMNECFPPFKNQASAASKQQQCGGSVFDTADSDCDDDGSEEEVVVRSPDLPVVIIGVDSLPRGALVEVEVSSLINHESSGDKDLGGASENDYAVRVHKSSNEYTASVLDCMQTAEATERGVGTVFTALSRHQSHDVDPFANIFPLIAADSSLTMRPVGASSASAKTAAAPTAATHTPLFTSVGVKSTWYKYRQGCCTGGVECSGIVGGSACSADASKVALSHGDYVLLLKAMMLSVKASLQGAGEVTSDNASRCVYPLSASAMLVVKVYYVASSGAEADSERDLHAVVEDAGKLATSFVFSANDGTGATGMEYSPCVCCIPVDSLHTTDTTAADVSPAVHLLCSFSCIDSLQLKTQLFVMREPTYT